MNHTISLRAAVPEDHEALYQLHRDSMGAYVEQTWGPWDDGVQRDFFRQRVELGLMEVIEVEGATAGILEVERTKERLSVVNIELAPAYQGRGIGGQLLNHLQREAAKLGIPVALQVLKINPARRLYERLGFVETGQSQTHYLMRWEPAASTPSAIPADS